MLTRLRVKNFRLLRDVEVEFDRNALSVLIGPNASGKSTVIEVLDFLARCANEGLEAAVLAHGGMNGIRTAGVDGVVEIESTWIFRHTPAKRSLVLRWALALDAGPNGQVVIRSERLQDEHTNRMLLSTSEDGTRAAFDELSPDTLPTPIASARTLGFQALVDPNRCRSARSSRVRRRRGSPPRFAPDRDPAPSGRGRRNRRLARQGRAHLDAAPPRARRSERTAGNHGRRRRAPLEQGVAAAGGLRPAGDGDPRHRQRARRCQGGSREVRAAPVQHRGWALHRHLPALKRVRRRTKRASFRERTLLSANGRSFPLPASSLRTKGASFRRQLRPFERREPPSAASFVPSNEGSLLPAPASSLRTKGASFQRRLRPFERREPPSSASFVPSNEGSLLPAPASSLRTKGASFQRQLSSLRTKGASFQRQLRPFERRELPSSASFVPSNEGSHLPPPASSPRTKGASFRRQLRPFKEKEELSRRGASFRRAQSLLMRCATANAISSACR